MQTKCVCVYFGFYFVLFLKIESYYLNLNYLLSGLEFMIFLSQLPQWWNS